MDYTAGCIINLHLEKVIDMGVVGSIIGGLGMAFLNGKAQQAQYEAQARAADQNAKIQQMNADIMAKNSEDARKQAEETARTNALNAELEARNRRNRIGTQKANIGRSGLSLAGSALNAVNDTEEDIALQTAKDLFNGRQNVDKLFGQSTNFTNQKSQYEYTRDVYRKNASDYREAGSRAFMTSMLTGAIQTGIGIWGMGGSAASSASKASVSGSTWNTSTGTWALDSAHMTIGTPRYATWFEKSIAAGKNWNGSTISLLR